MRNSVWYPNYVAIMVSFAGWGAQCLHQFVFSPCIIHRHEDSMCRTHPCNADSLTWRGEACQIVVSYSAVYLLRPLGADVRLWYFKHLYFPRHRGIPLNIEPKTTTPSGEDQPAWLTPEVVAWLRSLYTKKNEENKIATSTPLSDIPRMRKFVSPPLRWWDPTVIRYNLDY